MRPKTAEMLRNALINHGVQPEKHLLIINDVCGPKAVASMSKNMDTTDAQWLFMQRTLAYDRRTLTSNRKRWAPELVDIYEAYIALMDKVAARIDAAAAEHKPRETVTREAAAINRKREAEGKPLLGACGAQWQSWVPPHIRRQFVETVDLVYTKALRAQGNRWVPFASLSYRRDAKLRVSRIEASIADMRKAVADPRTGTSPTLYGALLLAGVRMAEIELYRRLKDYKNGVLDPIDKPIPIHWAQLCTPDMRARLRDAAENPAGIDPVGLSLFHDPSTLRPTDTTHAVTDALTDLPDESDV